MLTIVQTNDISRRPSSALVVAILAVVMLAVPLAASMTVESTGTVEVPRDCRPCTGSRRTTTPRRRNEAPLQDRSRDAVTLGQIGVESSFGPLPESLRTIERTKGA
jgi:hypothetical protein